MPRFTDGEGKEWEARITSGHIGELKKEAGFDLYDVVKDKEGKKLAELFDDAERFVLFLWIVCKVQAEKAGIDRQAFAYRIDGATIENAAIPVCEAVYDFFPQTRAAAKKLAAAARKVQEATGATVDLAMDAMMDKAIETAKSTLTSKLSALSSAGSAG